MIGWTTPSILIDSDSAVIASSSNVRRGWRGFGRTCDSSSSIMETWPAGNSATSAARPRPSPRLLATFNNLQRHPIVRVSPRAACIVPRDRQAMAGGLRQPDAARHDRIEDDGAEVLAHLAGDVAGQPGAEIGRAHV